MGWTDIQVITGIASTLFDALGYQSEVKTLSVPVTYASLKNKDIDVFLGNWMPSMTADVKPYFDDKSVEQLQPPNLEGAGYGIVVPQYVADAGVKSIADLAANKDKFGASSTASNPATTATASSPPSSAMPRTTSPAGNWWKARKRAC